MPDVILYSFLWGLIWIALLILPPGSTEIITSYRLNFIHGITCCLLAFLCLSGYISAQITTSCTISYFFVDFINILINDFYWKAPSYQRPESRRVEYAHHIFCFTFAVSSEIYYNVICTLPVNPFIKFMFSGKFTNPT